MTLKSQKKIVERVCTACKKLLDRENLIKITKLKDGTLKINPSSKELGRSLYVCNNSECIKLLIKKKRLKIGLKYSNNAEIERIEQELLKISQSGYYK